MLRWKPKNRHNPNPLLQCEPMAVEAIEHIFNAALPKESCSSVMPLPLRHILGA
jgi:hypothetical protein